MHNHASASGSQLPISGQVNFTLNGRPTSVEIEPGATLLDTLRDRLGVTSPKNGCQPQAECGCCTILVDNKPRQACAMAPEEVEGKEVTTLEGLSEEIRDQLASAFVKAGGLQCGFCIPGIAMRAASMLIKKPNPTRKEIAWGLRRHVCRCTGYVKIIDAIELFAKLRRGESLPESRSDGRVGSDLERYRAAETVLGQRDFVEDMQVEGMVYGALVLSEHPRALVKGIDTAKAAAAPGVIQVITAKDIPGERYVGLIERDWPVMVAIGEETRYVGDVLAVVVAESMPTARRAAGLVAVDYEVREPITNPRQALEPDAPRIHAKGNLLERAAIVYGDIEQALADSAHVVEHEFTTQRIEHLFLETEACLAVPNQDGGLKVFSQGQGVFDDQRQIAALLAVPTEDIYVELVANGGGFGGKEDMSIQGQTALAAFLTGRPVRISLTREESFRMHPKRHPMWLNYKLGCDEQGRLTGLHVRILGDTGAYASVGGKVLERAGGHAAGPYVVPHADIEAIAAYTNNPPCGAMRGFGVCQAAFAMEACLDMLAEKVGLDGWEMRWRNALDMGDMLGSGQRMTKPFGLKRSLLAVKDAYLNARYAGIACGIKNVGIGNGMADEGKAVLTVESDGTVTIRSGFTEMGQGLFTVLIQTAVEETGLSAEIFRATTDTSVNVNCGQTTASRGTVLGCHGVREAAKRLRADLDAGKKLHDLIGTQYRGDWAYTKTSKLGADVADPITHLTYGFATQVVILDDDGKLERVIAAHDVGRIMNPKQAEGQIEGAVHMGLGYALTEDFPCEDGQVKNRDINACGPLRAHHMPEVEVILSEEPDPECPYGAKGIGEIGLVPTAAAVHGALYTYDGRRRFALPMLDSEASAAIRDPAWKPARLREGGK